MRMGGMEQERCVKQRTQNRKREMTIDDDSQLRFPDVEVYPFTIF